LHNSRLKHLVAIALSSTLFLGFSFLDEVARRVEQGNQLFDREEFEAALEAYREAQTDRPDSPELHYNVGDALYKQGAIDEAIAAFQMAVESGDPTLGSKAFYNLGNALYKKQAFDQAVSAYEKALEMDSTDQDAKVNLEMALEKLEEQKKQDQEKGNDDKNNEDKENQQDKENQDQKDSESEQNQKRQDQDPQDQDAEEQQQPGELSEEEAERLLDALKDRESESQKRRRIRLQGKRYRGNPW
jgi:Ca-activated chloride channel family protein